MQQQKYRIAIIGTGARGEVFARQLHTGHPRATLFGVCDTDADRMATFCDYCQLDGARRFTDAAELLAQEGLDAVIITTPEFTHAPLAVAALEAGVHIYLEKPMAHTSAACREIVAAARRSKAIAYLGFNRRAVAASQRLKQIADSGILGQLIHVSGLEHLHTAHGASFMRRFHRHSARSGGLLNHKCSHDLDLMQWLVGYQHKVARVSSFGGTSIFMASKQPAPYCHQCAIVRECAYRDRAGFVFPVHSDRPLHHGQREVYGGDMCVYTADKDIVDNQTVIWEWDNGVRGSFNLQMFGATGRHAITLWGERGRAEYSNEPQDNIRISLADGSETIEHRFPQLPGHGGSDERMIDRLLDAVEDPDSLDSGLAAGLATTLLAESADRARIGGNVIPIIQEEYA